MTPNECTAARFLAADGYTRAEIVEALDAEGESVPGGVGEYQ